MMSHFIDAQLSRTLVLLFWGMGLFLGIHPCDADSSWNPQQWQFQCQRAEIAPEHWLEEQRSFRGRPTLALSGNGKVIANGCWTATMTIEPHAPYQFTSFYSTENIAEPNRSVLARILWFDAEGKQVERAEYPRTLLATSPEGWHIIQQRYKSPDKAVKAQLELVYRWDGGGMVYFGTTTLEKVAALESRMVRIAAVHHRPRNSKGVSENLRQFGRFVEQAGEKKADIVCLPEGITVVGTGKSYFEVSEPVPGPTTQFLGALAKKLNLYIVAGLYERDGEAVYNTAVLLDRQGRLQGKYRKVCLPREEIDGGITPGDSFPVFDTDFGRMGMMICWDVFFPEPARMLALHGAEIIFLPIWGGNINLAKARAIENQVYLVSSTYDMKTGVFDLEGELIVEGTDDNQIAVVDVDLNAQKLWPWLGDFKNRIPREMPPRRSLTF